MKRFIQPDPLGIDGGVSVYMWANLNPLFFVDPYGLCAESFWSQGIESALDNGMDWLQGKAQQASDSFSSFSDEYIYGPVAQQGDRVNDWLDRNVGVPGSESLIAVNDYLDDRSIAEKIGIAFTPIAAPLAVEAALSAPVVVPVGAALSSPATQFIYESEFATPGVPGILTLYEWEYNTIRNAFE